jgi:hypothetical protein
MFGLVSRRRYTADLNAAKAETRRQRERAELAEANAKTWRTAAETAARQFAEADAANKRLTGRNEALSDQLTAAQVASGFDIAQAKRTAARIARLQKAVARARAEAAAAPGAADRALRSELRRRNQAYSALEVQLLTVQKSNEAQAALLLDQAEGRMA